MSPFDSMGSIADAAKPRLTNGIQTEKKVTVAPSMKPWPPSGRCRARRDEERVPEEDHEKSATHLLSMRFFKILFVPYPQYTNKFSWLVPPFNAVLASEVRNARF
jgi:hypothetical protein